MSFITKGNNFLIYSIFQSIIQYTLLFCINIYQPFGTDACSVAHCLKHDACHRIPNSSVQRIAAGESPAYFNVFPKGFCQELGALTQQLGINYRALQMGTKGREIFSRDSLQSYTVKFFLSLVFFFIYFFLSSVNFFHVFVGFGGQCAIIKLMIFFSFVIRRAFYRSSFHRNIGTKKGKFATNYLSAPFT